MHCFNVEPQSFSFLLLELLIDKIAVDTADPQKYTGLVVFQYPKTNQYTLTDASTFLCEGFLMGKASFIF